MKRREKSDADSDTGTESLQCYVLPTVSCSQDGRERSLLTHDARRRVVYLDVRTHTDRHTYCPSRRSVNGSLVFTRAISISHINSAVCTHLHTSKIPKGVFIATQLNSTQLSPINERI